MAKSVEMAVSVEEVAAYFAELEDPRSEVNLKHPLVSVVTIAVMAVLAGAEGPTAIARWAKIKAYFQGFPIYRHATFKRTKSYMTSERMR